MPGLSALSLNVATRSSRTSRSITKSGAFSAADNLALVDGDIGDPATAAKIAETAMERFGTIDAVVNNAGIFFSKPFLDYTVADFRSLVSTNLEGFLYVTQLAIKQMLRQKSGGSIVNITTSMVDHPIAGINSAVPMITKGGLEAVTRSLAMEYAKEGIRVNAVAPGIVDTPMHESDPKDFLKSLVADGPDLERPRHRRRHRLSDRGRDRDRRSVACRRRSPTRASGDG